MRFIVGAADRVNPDLLISGWLWCEGIGGNESFVTFKGDGISDRGGIVGMSEELRYSLPIGLSRA